MYLMGEKEDLKKKLADALKENLRKRKEFQKKEKNKNERTLR
jgi:hypothetical protein